MGFDKTAIRFLLHLNRKEVRFDKTATLGRQSYQLLPAEIRTELQLFEYSTEDLRNFMPENEIYVDSFLKLLGADLIDSIDASPYEGATIVHDLNKPLPERLKAKYDVVIDAGTLEHVFNFPQAIENAMNLLKDGGSFISITTANNFFGHGFYQFSPELFYRVFSKENGFNVERMYFSTTKKDADWYELPDPKQVKGRIILENSYQSYLLIHARKLNSTEIFSEFPQQSDYEHIAWTDKGASKLSVNNSLNKQWLARLNLNGFMNKIKTSAIGMRIKTIIRPFGSGSKLYFKKIDIR